MHSRRRGGVGCNDCVNQIITKLYGHDITRRHTFSDLAFAAYLCEYSMSQIRQVARIIVVFMLTVV